MIQTQQHSKRLSGKKPEKPINNEKLNIPYLSDWLISLAARMTDREELIAMGW